MPGHRSDAVEGRRRRVEGDIGRGHTFTLEIGRGGTRGSRLSGRTVSRWTWGQNGKANSAISIAATTGSIHSADARETASAVRGDHEATTTMATMTATAHLAAEVVSSVGFACHLGSLDRPQPMMATMTTLAAASPSALASRLLRDGSRRISASAPMPTMTARRNRKYRSHPSDVVRADEGQGVHEVEQRAGCVHDDGDRCNGRPQVRNDAGPDDTTTVDGGHRNETEGGDAEERLDLDVVDGSVDQVLGGPKYHRSGIRTRSGTAKVASVRRARYQFGSWVRVAVSIPRDPISKRYELESGDRRPRQRRHRA